MIDERIKMYTWDEMNLSNAFKLLLKIENPWSMMEKSF